MSKQIYQPSVNLFLPGFKIHYWFLGLKVRFILKSDAVNIYKLNRWVRSSTEQILETKELLDKGVGFISVSLLDFSTAAGKLHFQILAAFAEFERALIRERTLEGLNRARRQGKKPGRPVGSKDGKKRRKSGYILREAHRRQMKDAGAGVNKPIGMYLN